jgi:O-acetyl-ADP-ribose deacetylase (regulator of RNase III)
MIKVVNGNILDAKENVIAHQVNCMGKMGAGVALEIRRKWPNVYEGYVNFCSEHIPAYLIGRTFLVRIGVNHYIANLFGQERYGRDKRYTDYDAIEKSLRRLKGFCKQQGNFSIALPYNMGCGNAGGDWTVVKGLIDRIFADYEGDVVIYKL